MEEYKRLKTQLDESVYTELELSGVDSIGENKKIQFFLLDFDLLIFVVFLTLLW